MKFNRFRVFNYRNIHDSGLIDVSQITAFVGQNEAGKSNLFDALYRVNPFDNEANYNFDEDWPVDKWGTKETEGKEAKVCEVYFEIEDFEIDSLFDAAVSGTEVEETEAEETENKVPSLPIDKPKTLTITGTSYYHHAPRFEVDDSLQDILDGDKVDKWAKEHFPKFVYIYDYDLTGTGIELDELKARYDKYKTDWDKLSNEDQTMKIVLDLAKINLDEIVAKGATPEGRTDRVFDTTYASKYLTK